MGMVYLPAVSRITASSKNHQSQLRVAEMPVVGPVSVMGELRPAFLIAEVFPDPDSPMTRYHGNT